jgi:hypothetical protein
MSKSDPPPKNSSESARILELEFEPLSEPRWHKIEQRVFARLDAGELPSTRDSNPSAPFSTRRASVWALGLAASLLLVVLALSRSNRSAAPTVSRISTGVTASHVALPGVVLDVSPQSAVVVSGSAEESALIVLDRGEVTCDVAHRRPGAPLFVQAGELSVEVVGTRFTVTRQEEVARVTVQEGLVRVKFRGRSSSVKAGETWPLPLTAAASPAPSVAEVPRPHEQPEALSSAGSSVGTLRPREPTPRPRVIKETKEAKEAKEAKEENSSTEASPPSVQHQFEMATRIEAKEPAEAIRLYEGIESSGSGWASNALFAHGRLEAARGNRVAARRILTQYLRRFPAGANAPDARLLLSRLE